MRPNNEPQLRNASLEFTAEGHLVAFDIYNVMGLEGTYKFTLTSVDDDYPDALSEYVTSQPLRADETTSGRFDHAHDSDLFRYDVPEGHGNYVEISMQGPAGGSALIDVYEAVPPTAPTGAGAVASGVGWIAFNPVAGRSYYVWVRNSVAGDYQLEVSPSSCGPDCDLRGTFDNPLALPSENGGLVTGRLASNAFAANFDWDACANGETCDWYGMYLQRGERMTATVYRVYDAGCAIELSVFGPPEQEYFGSGAATYRWPSLTDQGGSMEERGAQLVFEAPADGLYRIRLQTTHVSGADCPGYDMTAVRGMPSIHVAPDVE